VQLKGSKMSDVIKETTIVWWIIDCGNVTEKKASTLSKQKQIRDAVMRRDGKKAQEYAIDMVLLNTILMPMHSSMILILMPHTKL
jgi:hypothetical protein